MSYALLQNPQQSAAPDIKALLNWQALCYPPAEKPAQMPMVVLWDLKNFAPNYIAPWLEIIDGTCSVVLILEDMRELEKLHSNIMLRCILPGNTDAEIIKGNMKLALKAHQERETQRKHTHDLEQRLCKASVVRRAKHWLREHWAFDEDRAHHWLQRQSQAEQKKKHIIARQVVQDYYLGKTVATNNDVNNDSPEDDENK